jgi:hypothetical protein
MTDERSIDVAFHAWIEKVEAILRRPIPVTMNQAFAAFTCFEAPTKPLTPEEYARELASI